MKAKYWLAPLLIAMSAVLTVLAVQAIQDANVVSPDEYRQNFLSDPADVYNEIISSCRSTTDRSDVLHTFQGKYGIKFRVRSEPEDIAENQYLNCFAERLTGETIEDLPFPDDRTQGDFIVEQTSETSGGVTENYVNFFPNFID